jgi:hypothetical protein
VTVGLALMSLLYLAYLVRPNAAGIGVGFGSSTPYAFDLGASLFRNLITYIGWTVDLAMLRPGLRFVDRQDPALLGLSCVVLAVVIVVGLWPPPRKRGWFVGLGCFFLLLAPVLPLRNHTYHYYLYLPLVAASFCLATRADSWFEMTVRRERGGHGAILHPMRPQRAWIIAGVCWLAFTWNGDRLVTQMEMRPSPVYPGLRGDPIVDRALIAERVINGLRSAAIPPGTEMLFIMRERLALIARIVRGSGEPPPPAQELYPETNVKAALFDGVGVRVFVPAVDSVTFALSLGQPMKRRRYAVYAPTGAVEVFDATSLDSLLRGPWVTRW